MGDTKTCRKCKVTMTPLGRAYLGGEPDRTLAVPQAFDPRHIAVTVYECPKCGRVKLYGQER
jgi:hypothetical protein